MWWVVAGNGRPGSVAARKLVFDPDWSDVLWSRLRGARERSFVAVPGVDYVVSDAPSSAELRDFRWL